MTVRRRTDPSPFRSGALHAAASFALFSALSLAFGAGVHALGDEADAGPRETLALFEPKTAAPVLKARLEAPEPEANRQIAALALPEPSLGVDYYPGDRAPGEKAPAAAAPVEQGDAAQGGVRINGQLVMPGQSLSDVVAAVAPETAPEAGLWERDGAARLPKIADDGRTPLAAYAKPFANPENRPMIAIVVGGLGINRTHTQSAIDELPPEVTLSFSPSARGLQRWIDKARAAGHEVLLEAPMEPYDYGRVRPHPQTLATGLSADANVDRLEWLLGRATGYFGITNSEGGRLAANRKASDPIFAALAERGVGFIEDGGLARSTFDDAAKASGAAYAAAAYKIDETAQADAIEAKLLELEAKALEDRAALATGFAYPVTIDVLKAWTERLYGKGYALAPASALMSAPQTPTRVTALPSGAGDPAP